MSQAFNPGTGLFMNKTAKTVFEKHSILNHQFIKGSIKSKLFNKSYYLLHIVNPNFNGIDFSKSSFCETDMIGDIEKTGISIESEEEYWKKANSIAEFNYIKIEKLKLNQPYTKLDLFLFPYSIHDRLIASEKLVNDLVNENITGLKIKEIDYIIP